MNTPPPDPPSAPARVRRVPAMIAGWIMTAMLAGCAASRPEARSPMNMQHEMGRYRPPDIVLNGTDPGTPTTLSRCGERRVIYAVNLQPGTCDVLCPIPPFQCAPCAVALDRATTYLRDHFRCDNPGCRRVSSEIVWMGWSCHRDESPPLQTFTCAIELEAWCDPEP